MPGRYTIPVIKMRLVTHRNMQNFNSSYVCYSYQSNTVAHCFIPWPFRMTSKTNAHTSTCLVSREALSWPSTAGHQPLSVYLASTNIVGLPPLSWPSTAGHQPLSLYPGVPGMYNNNWAVHPLLTQHGTVGHFYDTATLMTLFLYCHCPLSDTVPLLSLSLYWHCPFFCHCPLSDSVPSLSLSLYWHCPFIVSVTLLTLNLGTGCTLYKNYSSAGMRPTVFFIMLLYQ